MERRKLPAELGDTFTVAAALRAGVTPGRLAAQDLARPFHGVRTVSPGVAGESAADRIHSRMRHYAARMRDGEFFSHATAAIAWGIPLPARFLREEQPLDVGVHWPHRSPRSRGIRGHAIQPELATFRAHPIEGYAVASPASTWAMLGGVLLHPYDLIAAGDFLVRAPQHPRDPPALATIDQLAASVDAGRRIGVPELRAALPRVRSGAASRPETWLRLTLVDGGLPEPLLNIDVYEGGAWLARVDAGYLALKIAIEYEGEHHLRDPAQWAADIARYDRLAAAGWRVIRVTKTELFLRPGALLSRVREALRVRDDPNWLATNAG